MNTAPGALVIPPEQGGDSSQELAYRLRQQQLTAEFGHFALVTHDLEALLQEATRVCALGMQSRLCKVMEFLPDEGQFIVRAGVGWKPGVVGFARAGADTESPAGYVFKTGEPVLSNHLEGETRFRTPEILRDHGVKRAFNVLVRRKSKRFGVLEVDSSESGQFSIADMGFMQGFANLVGVAIERQEAEQALRASEERLQISETRLNEAMKHQEVLTREISHRVKNSLALVAGLLNMQGRMARDADLKRALDDAQGRVHTIAQVHDRLWRSNEVHSVDLAEFMTELCQQLSQSAPAEDALRYEFAQVTIATDQAVPLGLLVNELVTNAFKYAYPDGAGTVLVLITPSELGHIRLEVSDTGVGLPSGFDAASSKSLGMKLITSLARQLGGRAEWQDAQPGARFVLDFFPQS